MDERKLMSRALVVKACQQCNGPMRLDEEGDCRCALCSFRLLKNPPPPLTERGEDEFFAENADPLTGTSHGTTPKARSPKPNRDKILAFFDAASRFKPLRYELF